MRVLHIINSLGRGGAETQLTYLAMGLCARGVKTDIAYLATGKGSAQNETRLRDAGVTLHRLSSESNYDPRLLFQIRKLIAETQPDLVQTWLTMMDVFGGAAAISSGVPWILSERNAEPDSVSSMRMRLRRFLARGAGAIVANSVSGSVRWAESVHGSVICEVVPNALPHTELESTLPIDREAQDFPASSPLILYAGRFEEQKNIDNLLTGLELVLRESDATAILFGHGELETKIEEFIQANGLEGRLLIGGFSTELWTWIRACDVFVSVSHYEGMPNAVMEAMALGRTVVVSDIRQHREICDESCATLVDRESPRAIADGILQCLASPELAKKRGQAAKQVAQDWTIEASAEKYEAIYARLLGDSFRA